MTLLRRLLNLLPHDTLMIRGAPYMRRWYLVGYAPPPVDPHGEPGTTRKGWWWNGTLPFAIRLHETVASDDSRAFHDHPWPFLSIGLAGAYVEVTPADVVTDVPALFGDQGVCSDVKDRANPRRRFRAPFVNRKAATDLHVLEVDAGPVWTLFCTPRKQRSWGFSGPFGWIPWREFDVVFPEREGRTEVGR